MVVGFISLLLTFGQTYIATICVPSKYGHAMSFCAPYDGKKYKKANRQMINFSPHRRSLADAAPVKCKTVIFVILISNLWHGFFMLLIYIDKIVFHFFFRVMYRLYRWTHYINCIFSYSFWPCFMWYTVPSPWCLEEPRYLYKFITGGAWPS